MRSRAYMAKLQWLTQPRVNYAVSRGEKIEFTKSVFVD
jgi:hypothetical protein